MIILVMRHVVVKHDKALVKRDTTSSLTRHDMTRHDTKRRRNVDEFSPRNTHNIFVAKISKRNIKDRFFDSHMEYDVIAIFVCSFQEWTTTVIVFER